jgi:hypothetical protein
MKKFIKRAHWPDTHIPFESESSVKIALDLLEAYRPDEVIIYGDFWDCYCVSRYGKNPHKMAVFLSEEIEKGEYLLHEIIRKSRAKKFIFLEGNHEARLKAYIHQAPAIANLLPPIKNVFKIPKKWLYIPYGKKQAYNMGNMVARHKTFQSVHVCHKTITRSNLSIMLAHTHRVQYHAMSTLQGNLIEAWSIGWLGDPDKAAEYMDVEPEWCNAVSLSEHCADKSQVQIITIENGQAIFNEKFYTSNTKRFRL